MTLSELAVPLAWGGATHLAMWTAGSWMRERIVGGPDPADDRAGRAFQSAMLGFAMLGVVAFALGALHVLYAPLLAAVIAVVAGAGMVRLLRARLWVKPEVTLLDVPMISCAVFILAHVPRALYPVLEHDESVYHLLLPKLYLSAHALVPLSWSLFANMPHLVDLSFVFPMALGGFAAAKVFVLGFMAWTLVGLAPFGRTMLGPMGPGVLAVLYLSGRVVQWHLGLVYVEPVIGAVLLCALLSLWRFREDGESAELLILALMVGAAFASKYTVWPHAALFLATAVLVRSKGRRRVGRGVVAVMVGLVALLAVPWLVKNALVTGNPIYPNAYGVFGGTHWSQIQAVQFQHELGFGRGADRELATYLELPLRLVTGSPDTNRLVSANFSGGLMILLIASMAFPWRRVEYHTALRLFSIAGAVFWCVGSKQPRFLVAFVPVMVVTAGVALVPLRRWGAALASATIAVTLVALAQMKWQPYPTPPSLDVFTVSRDELMSRNLCWRLTEFLNRIVPRNGHVLSFWDNRLYFLDRPFIADSSYGAPTMLASLREAGDAHSFAARMASEGVTHVVVHPYFYSLYMANDFYFDLLDESIYPAERLETDKELFERFVTNELESVPWDGEWAVFRLKAAPANPS